MGRQILFYATSKDIAEMINYIKSFGWIIIKKNGDEINADFVYDLSLSNSSLFIKTISSKIELINYSDGSGVYLDKVNSEIVEFMLPFRYFFDSQSKNNFHYGRFYIETDKYKNSPICKMLYDSNVKYVKNNFFISDNHFAYIGKDAYHLYKKGKYVPINFSGKF